MDTNTMETDTDPAEDRDPVLSRREYMRQYMAKRRQNQTFRRIENERNKDYKRKKRSAEANLFTQETLQKDYKRQRGQNESVTDAEETGPEFEETSAHVQFNNLLAEFQKTIRQAPSSICSCCGGLWYEKYMFKISDDSLRDHGIQTEVIEAALYLCDTDESETREGKLCSTCKSYVWSRNPHSVPRMALVNGLELPPIPDVLKDLTPLEERLVSPRIPFMQIRLLGHEKQSALRGNVVNVECELDVCSRVLPREFSDISVIPVQLRRRISHKHPYMYEFIRPAAVYEAAKYLSSQPLYRMENIQLSEDWIRYKNGDTLEYTVDPPSHDFMNNSTDNANADIESSDSDADMDDRTIENEVGAEETLIFSEKETFKGIAIAPAEGNTPQPLFKDINAEQLSFPKIFCGQPRQLRGKLSQTDIAKSYLRNYTRRACTPTYVLYAFKRSFNEKLAQAMQICLRKRTGNNVTAGFLKDKNKLQALLDKDDGYTVFKNIRSSPCYWKEQQKRVLAMIRQQGTPHFFITHSAAETKWNELIQMLMKILRNASITEDEAASLSFETKCELIRQDPVTCMRHFEHRFRALLQLMKKRNSVFREHELLDYFTRMEFQLRGSPHIHGLYWLKDAPKYVVGDETALQTCCKFIDRFVTCERCEDGVMQQYIAYQLHKHTQTCRKRRNKICRFGFPKPPLPQTVILQALPKFFPREKRFLLITMYQNLQKSLSEKGPSFKEDIPFDTFLSQIGVSYEDYILTIRSSIIRTTVFLKRKTSECYVNNYNKQMLEAWGANMDIQFITDTYACAKYCVGYIAKAEGGVSKLLQAATKDVKNGNLSAREQVKKFASILINGSEISAQEATAFLLGIPNTFCSRSEVFINTSEPQERVRMLKPHEEILQMNDCNEDVFQAGVVEHYPKRPLVLENVCLAEFASFYECRRPSENKKNHLALQDNSRLVIRRGAQKIIRFRRYGKQADPVNFYREKLMLFFPWRDEYADIINTNVIEKAQNNWKIIIKNSTAYIANEQDYEQLNDIVGDLEHLENMNDNDSLENEFGLCHEGHDAFSQTFNTLSGEKVQQFLPPKLIPYEDYIKLMRALNNKQRKFVLNALHCLKTGKTPFHFFLSGGAGVGKSHCLTALVQSYLWYNKDFPTTNPEEFCVIVSAPTGKAAFNVFGMTLHTTFRLPPNQRKNGVKLCDLDSSAISTLRTKLRSAKLFVIDEISMVSVKQLYDIDQRLRQIFDTCEAFGGKSIVVVGDFRQLPPLPPQYAFMEPTHLPLGVLAGNPLWEKFQLYKLDEVMRQKDDHPFCKALNNMAIGEMDEQDIHLLRSREISELVIPPEYAIRVFPTNKQCDSYNQLIHQELRGETAVSFSHDKVQGCGTEDQKRMMLEYAKTLDHRKADGLPFKTRLKIGAQYFVSTNVDVPDGLFNGATGTLVKIDYGITSKNERVPKRAWLTFSNSIIGATTRANYKVLQPPTYPTAVPIKRETKTLSVSGILHGLSIVRQQIPLVAANGMTIHKAQGSTLKEVVVCVRPHNGRKLSREHLYVACSRSTFAMGLFIDGVFEPPAKPDENSPVSNELQRLRQVSFRFSMRFLQDVGSDYRKIYFQNVQSFNLHRIDVFADQCAISSDFMAFVEPHLVSTDNLDTSTFQTMLRENCSTKRNSEGALVLVKSGTVGPFGPKNVTKLKSANGHCVIIEWSIDDVTILMCYKSNGFTNSSFINQLRSLLDRAMGKVIVVGDINIDLRKPEGVQFIDSMNLLGLTSKFLEYPSTTNYGSHIDVCFSNFLAFEAWIYESYFSYHKAICIVLKK